MAEPAEAKKATIAQYLGLFGYKVFCGMLAITHIRLVAALGCVVGYLAWMALPSRRRIVARNLRIILDPTLRPTKMSTMVRRNMVRTCMNMICAIKTGLMSDREMKKNIRVVGAAELAEMGKNGHTAIAGIPHDLARFTSVLGSTTASMSLINV